MFVGPSNTGKSWLATLAYALHRYFWRSRRGRLFWFRTEFDAPALPDNVGQELIRIAERLTPSASGSAEQGEGSVELTAAVEATIRSHIEEQGEALGAEIERCFGVDAGSQLVRKGGAERARILLRHAVDGAASPAVHRLSFEDDGWTLRSTGHLLAA